MKRILLCLIGLCTSLFGGWEESWVQGIQACKNKEWDKAHEKFDEALAAPDVGENTYHILVDKSRVYLYNDQNELALEYVEKGLKGGLQGDDQIRAMVTKSSALSRLNRTDESIKVTEEMKGLVNFPKMEIYDNYVIMRNFPDCDCALKMIKKIMLHLFCESEDDITLECGILRCKRTKQSPCEGGQCSPPDFQGAIKPYRALTECQWYCDRVYQAGINYCNHHFKSFRCNALCQVACEGLKSGCYWCCGSNGFYANCIKPFEDIVGSMGGVCDPAWD
jgi:hypothetical protein